MDIKIKTELLNLARRSIEFHFTGQFLDETQYTDPFFQEKRGAFVTLHKDGQLRGCIGYIIPYKSVYKTIIEMARAAAFRDPRFRPLNRDELNAIDIEISILSDMIKIQNIDEIVIGRDGLLIEHPLGHGVLLPQVATEFNWDIDTYLKQLCNKAGLEKNAWEEDSSTIYRFSAEVFGEKE